MSPTRFHLVLYQPVIPQNTGSIARLCACTGATLHLIHPLGFDIDEKAVRRAGLDYWSQVEVKSHVSWGTFLKEEQPEHLYFFTKFAKTPIYDRVIQTPTYLVFGSETKGLPQEIHDRYASSLCQIPMRTQVVRSLNLAQSAAIGLYEALRQNEALPQA